MLKSCGLCSLKNIKFGIWIEPEMISFDSELYRTHPEYALYDKTVNPTVLRHQFVLDITQKEVRDYIFNQIKTLFEEYHLIIVNGILIVCLQKQLVKWIQVRTHIYIMLLH